MNNHCKVDEHILLVDDETVLLTMTEQLLNNRGCIITSFSSSPERKH